MNIKIIDVVFAFLFWIKSSNRGVCFTLTSHLSSDGPISCVVVANVADGCVNSAALDSTEWGLGV